MNYNYRWVYAVGICASVLLIGYLLDIQSSWDQVTELHQTEKQLSEKLSINPVFATQLQTQEKITALSPQIKQWKSFNDLIMLAHVFGLSIQSLNSLTSQSSELPEGILLRLIANGNFQQTSNFLLALNKQNISTFDFSVQSNESDQLHLVMDVLLLPTHSHLQIDNQHQTSSLLYSPFCAAGFTMQPSQLSDSLNYSLSQMKMVGYLQQGPRHQALVLLPNQTVVTVTETSILGSEQGIVQIIQRDQVLIQLPNQKQIILKTE